MYEITSAKIRWNEWTYFVLVMGLLLSRSVPQLRLLPQHNWQQPRRDLVLGYWCSRIRETRRMFICHYHVQRVEVTRAGGGCSLGLTIPGTISNFNISRGPGLTSRTLLPYHHTSTASHMINMIWLDISVQELVNLWYLNMNIISMVMVKLVLVYQSRSMKSRLSMVYAVFSELLAKFD